MLHRVKSLTGLLMAITSLMFLITCQNYYMASTRTNSASNLDSLKQRGRYFILRSGSNAYHLKDMVLSNDRKALEATLEVLPNDHELHLGNGINGKMRYKKNDPLDKPVLSEVHLYVEPGNLTTVGERFTLPLEQVQKIEVIEIDKKRTTNSYVLGAIGYTLGAVALTTIIIAATKSSCPFVSAYDGTQFSLQGEIYGGAIYPQLARHDFLPLKMTPLKDNSLQVKISNELKERQYTDVAELWVVTHPKQSEILIDEKGNLLSVSQPKSPVSALLNNKKEVSAQLRLSGDNALLYMDDTSSLDTRNEVVLKFKTEGAREGMLVLTLKNSYWLDLLYGELAKGFGTYYSTYIKQQQNKPAAELLKWTSEQQIPLEISVKAGNEWKKITDITTVGPLAMRQMAVPIDLSEAEGEFAEIKLSSGFMFWEIDYAAMDFSAEYEWSLQKLQPNKATDEQGRDVSALLQNEDGQFLEQPNIGNVATIVYNGAATPGTDQTQSYFLKTKGYYEHIRDFKNKPDIRFLQQFRKPGSFPKYGMALYKKVSQESMKDLARSN